jgi:hypothetical protein
MHHVKLIVLGIVLVLAVVFGSIFWDDFKWNQQEIANTKLPPETDYMEPVRKPNDISSSDSYDSMEKDLDKTEVNDVDSDSAQIEASASGL